MTKTEQNFEVFQGQTKPITIPVVDEAGNPRALTGFTPTWYAFEDPSDDLGDAIVSKTGGDISLVNVNGTDDGIQFTLDPADSDGLDVGRYYHEVWADDGAGDEQPVTTGWFLCRPSPKGRS